MKLVSWIPKSALLSAAIWTGFLTSQAIAATSESDCPDYDYSSHFPPERNQNGHDNCWAFVATALLEEDQCLQDPKACGKALSPLDASRCNWQIGKSEEDGQTIDTGLKCALENGGICAEKYAPYHDLLGTQCYAWSWIGLGESCTHDELGSIFTRWKEARLPCASVDSFDSIRKSLGNAAESMDWLIDRFHVERETVLQALQSSKTREEFLRKVMISRSCAENRAKPTPNLSVIQISTLAPADSSAQGKLSILKKALKSGRSVGIGVDLEKMPSWISWIYSKNSGSNSDSSHALVVSGMRYNHDTRKCEVQLRNSWGSSAPLNGWHNAEAVLDAIQDTAFLGDTSNPDLQDVVRKSQLQKGPRNPFDRPLNLELKGLKGIKSP